MARRAIALMGTLLLIGAAAAAPVVVPKRLAIYYGYPSQVNGSANNAQAIAAFDDFDLIVLGAGLEHVSHPDHANTVAIIAGLPATAEVYGYIDVGNTNWRTLSDIQSSVTEWDAMGVDGIFYDEFGYDFQVTRARQNTVIGYAHAAGLSAFVNGYIPDESLGNEVDTALNSSGEAFNPAGTPTALSSSFSDSYLLENLTVAFGQWHSPSLWWWRASRARHFADTLGIRIHVCSTADTLTQAQIDAGFWATLMWDFESFQHTYSSFSSSGPGATLLALSAWPAGHGSSWVTSRVERLGRLERQTDTGLIEVHGTTGDSGSFGSSFTPGGVAGADYAYPITVGGGTAEWAAIPAAIVDPDETPTTPGGADFGSVHLTNDATNLHLRLTSFDSWNLSSDLRLWLDTDRDRTTGYRLDFLGVDRLVEGDQLYAFVGANQSDWNFTSLGAVSASPTTGITDFEMAIPRAGLGLSAAGSSVSLLLTNSASTPDDLAPGYGPGPIFTYPLTEMLVPVGLSWLGAD